MSLPVLMSSSACLVLPEYIDRPEAENRSPVIDPASVSPTPTLFEADTRCPCFRIALEVTDPDNDALLVRLGADLGRGASARCDSEFPLGPAARPQRFTTLIVPAQIFETTPEVVHTLSVFVTDGPGFTTPVETAGDRCGAIARANADGGVTESFVVEQRFTVRFVPELGECPGCPAP